RDAIGERAPESLGPQEIPVGRVLGDESVVGAAVGQNEGARSGVEINGIRGERAGDVNVPSRVDCHRPTALFTWSADAQRELDVRGNLHQTRAEVRDGLAGSAREDDGSIRGGNVAVEIVIPRIGDRKTIALAISSRRIDTERVKSGVGHGKTEIAAGVRDQIADGAV